MGLWLLGVASFAETVIVPIPIEIVLVPYMMARRDLIWTIALVTTIGCLLGAILGYAAGYLLYDTLGRALIEAMGWESAFQAFRTWFDADGFWAILAVGLVPIPFQIAMLTAGVSAYPFLPFLLAAGIARGIRYFGLALLVALVGERALALWRRHRKSLLWLLAGSLLIWLLQLQLFDGSPSPEAGPGHTEG
jgi:membrane protein YqaA with SNARE-associated domain